MATDTIFNGILTRPQLSAQAKPFVPGVSFAPSLDFGDVLIGEVYTDMTGMIVVVAFSHCCFGAGYNVQ